MLTMKMIFLTYVYRKGKNYFEISYTSPLLEQHPALNPHSSFPNGNPREPESLSPLKSHTLQSTPPAHRRTKRLA